MDVWKKNIPIKRKKPDVFREKQRAEWAKEKEEQKMKSEKL